MEVPEDDDFQDRENVKLEKFLERQSTRSKRSDFNKKKTLRQSLSMTFNLTP